MKIVGMSRFATILRWGAVAVFIGLVAGGTLTFAADRPTLERPAFVPTAAKSVRTLTVPRVTGQAYVFAKGILQDGGFAWRVVGPVRGYAANRVTGQQPRAGTVVLDTGAPTVTLTLKRNRAYNETGVPENGAPYRGTKIRLPAHKRTRPVVPASRTAAVARPALARPTPRS